MEDDESKMVSYCWTGKEREREIKIGNVLLDYHPGRVSHLFSVGLGLHKSIRDEKKKKGGL